MKKENDQVNQTGVAKVEIVEEEAGRVVLNLNATIVENMGILLRVVGSIRRLKKR